MDQIFHQKRKDNLQAVTIGITPDSTFQGYSILNSLGNIVEISFKNEARQN